MQKVNTYSDLTVGFLSLGPFSMVGLPGGEGSGSGQGGKHKQPPSSELSFGFTELD